MWFLLQTQWWGGEVNAVGYSRPGGVWCYHKVILQRWELDPVIYFLWQNNDSFFSTANYFLGKLLFKTVILTTNWSGHMKWYLLPRCDQKMTLALGSALGIGRDAKCYFFCNILYSFLMKILTSKILQDLGKYCFFFSKFITTHV